MVFQVGDKVVHRSYGPGEIIQLDEKALSGRKTHYYVVQVRDLTLWVPTADMEGGSLRNLTPASEFQKLFTILGSPAEPLSSDRLERKSQLSDRIKDGTLESICCVIRDLSYQRRMKKLSDSDQSLLERAQSFLLCEWGLSLSVPVSQAEGTLTQLLSDSLTRSNSADQPARND